jgi:hypothetical protein
MPSNDSSVPTASRTTSSYLDVPLKYKSVVVPAFLGSWIDENICFYLQSPVTRSFIVLAAIAKNDPSKFAKFDFKFSTMI